MIRVRSCQSGAATSTSGLTHGTVFRKGVWHRQALQDPPRGGRLVARANTAAKWLAELRDGTVKVLFNMKYRCGFGQHLAVVGNKDSLGGWDVERSVQMEWSEGDMWIGEVVLDGTIEEALEYKYVVRQADGTVLYWKPGENIRLEINGGEVSEVQEVVVGDAWDGASQSVQLVAHGAVENGAAAEVKRDDSLPFSDEDYGETEASTVEMMEAQAQALEAEQREAEAQAAAGQGCEDGDILEEGSSQDEAEVERVAAEKAKLAKEAEAERAAEEKAKVAEEAEARIRAEATQAVAGMDHLSVDEKAQQINQRVEEVSSNLSDCLSGAKTDSDIEECLVATDLSSQRTDEKRPKQEPPEGKMAKYADLSMVLEGMYDSAVASYIVETVTEKALNDLDAALQRSQELQAKGGDPTAPELLAADRLVAAAAKRAVDMSRALDATKTAGMITAGMSDMPEEEQENFNSST